MRSAGVRRRKRRPPLLGPLVAVVSLAFLGWGDAALEKGRDAEKRYRKGDLAGALGLLEEARALRPGMPELDYNSGVVLYRQQKWDEAGERFGLGLRGEEAQTRSEPPLRARAHYNRGNALFQQGDYQGAVEAYTQALGVAPQDEDAKYNLELALKRLEQAEQQPQAGGQGKPQDDSGKPQQGSGGGQGSRQDREEQPEQPSSENSQERPSPEEQAGSEPEPSPAEESARTGADSTGRTPQELLPGERMSPEDARRLLEALRYEEGRVLDKEQKERARVRERVTHGW